MALETVNNIADFVNTNPTSADPKSQGDDQIRNLKIALLNDFAGFTGAICVTGTDGGAANAYTLTPANALPAYGTKMIAVFAPTANNTGAATLNISGLGAKNIKSVSGAALTSGDLIAGSVYAAFYNGTEFRLLSITKNYVDQLAFSTALPAQSAGVLTSDGTTAGFSALLKAGIIRLADSTDTTKRVAFDLSGITAGQTRTITLPDSDLTLSASALKLLATLTPTAAANLDALSTFSPTYDNYLIVGHGILPSADDNLMLRFASAGSADAGSNYYRRQAESATAATAGSTSMEVAATVLAAGKGCNFALQILNANDVTNVKAAVGKAAWQTNATPGYIVNGAHAVYPAANAISGIRLFWNGGNNFAASGKVRIYGYNNT